MVRLRSALRLARLFLSLDALMSRCNLCFCVKVLSVQGRLSFVLDMYVLVFICQCLCIHLRCTSTDHVD